MRCGLLAMWAAAIGLKHLGAVLRTLCALAMPACAMGAGAEAVHARSDPTISARAGEQFDFDIPAQPLIGALQRYGSVVRKPTLYRSEIVSGQTSSPVHGRHAPEDALRLLLEGTGLVAERFEHASGNAFVLRRAEAARAAGLGPLTGYPGMLQARVWHALCAQPQTRPGGYRALLRFQVDAAGHLQRPRLLGSSGDARRDAALVAALQRVRLDGAPPADLPQPVTMLLLPHAEGFALRCEDGARATP